MIFVSLTIRLNLSTRRLQVQGVCASEIHVKDKIDTMTKAAREHHMQRLQTRSILGACGLIVLSLCFCTHGATKRDKAAASYAAKFARGEAVYMNKACNMCHGNTGRGDGPVGKHLTPPPTDFTQGFKYGDELEQIVRSTQNGIPGTSMVGYHNALSPAEIADVSAYVRYFLK